MKLTDLIEVDDFFILDDTIPLMSKMTGVRVYDFNFRQYFATRSILYPPEKMVVEKEFTWPIFVKGERQTNRHKKSLSIIENAAAFEELLGHWKQNTMLHWQKMVCREYVPL